MKFQSFTLLYLWIILALPVQAQVVRKIQPPNAPNAPHFSNAQHKSMEALRGPVAMTPNPSKEKKNWDVMLSQHGVSHGSDVPKTVLDSIKSNLAPQKRLSDGKSDPSLSENGGAENSVVDPYVTLDFKGNTYNGWTPTDNSVAVSDDGYIVSVVNSSLMFATDDGTVLLEESFDSYLDFLNLTGSYFDPRVIYDPIEDKFIMVVLSGNSPSNSNVVIGFSTTSDPTDTWWFYVYDGDPTNTNKWFDFPSIGVSATEIFISGNLFTSNDVFDQVVIYEFEKARGFAGQNLGGWFWDDVRDADGNRDFTVVPISFGFDGAIGPGIFFISSNSGGGNEVMMYYTTDIGANNPTLEVFSASTAQYDVPINGYQLGSSDEIMTNDCRIQSGYWANGILHFVLNTAHTDLYTRIYYGRLNTDNLTVDARRFGLTEYEYAFPSVIPFTTDETDQTALIAFLRTGSAIYPQFRVVTCDNAGAFSGSVLVKGGEDYVDFSFDSQERWGDYSGISRRHLNNEVEVWVAGSYGAFFDGGDFNILSTWVARISDEDIAAPVANFVGNPTTVTAGQLVLFTDLSTNTPTTWAWSFPGGSPTTSVVKDPAIIYNTPGTYNVSLTASNSAGSDGETKTAYITVNPLVIAPVANFSANQTVITAGQSVQFTDLSTNTPTAWAWSFPGGTPVSSSVKNPLITYNTPGTYNVSLTASNSAGSDGETKIAYITVNPNVIAPVAN
ncbi:MAG: PKD domain-containing protein, partial [Saprospiraceae bacterium]|nr:PKD domain-containing protein [Saprospiraceae bacterium]